ncbi:MAG: MBL fold metallo-hydrolase [Nocardioidaceae bacterium]
MTAAASRPTAGATTTLPAVDRWFRLRRAHDVNDPADGLTDGDRLDLGDRTLTVHHLPGHTPGSIGLLDEPDGAFFTGDVVHDDVLLDRTAGADQTAYAASIRRLRELPVRVVRPGHGDSFGPERLRVLADAYPHGRRP